MRQKIRTENFWWNKENYCDSPHLRGEIDGNLKIINRNTNGSRCEFFFQSVGSAGSAGPGGPAARTDSDDLFFLERATFYPTWMRPLSDSDKIDFAFLFMNAGLKSLPTISIQSFSNPIGSAAISN